MKITKQVYLVGSGKLGFDWTHPSDCNIYLLDAGDSLVLIDCGTGLFDDAIAENLKSHGFQLRDISLILLTHLHADHAGGARKWKEMTGAEVAVMAGAAEALAQGDESAIDLPRARSAGFYPQDYVFQPCKPDRLLEDGSVWNTNKLEFQALYTPGHSRFDISYYVRTKDKEFILFSGDTVMYNGKISIQNTSDFHLQQLAESIEKLSELQVDTLLPGHGQPAMRNGSRHILRARDIFRALGVPPSIV